ncbi:MAG: hypothetical protein IJS28_04040 [Synergistaceae bacterium]|nr:hypothetical protein [Synergistaceae bacterium]
MSVVYPDDYPKTMHEAIMAAMEVKDEDIDLSDIPEITEKEAVLAEPVGDRFIELRRKNAMFINRLLNEYYAKKGIVL